MPLPRPLLQLCALLLIVFAVTAAHAAAPPYRPNEVKITITQTTGVQTRSAQNATCAASGGVLLPMVTNAVYHATSNQMKSSGIAYAIGHIGASSMLSPATCTTSAPSLDCIWYWDEGRYAGAGNALAFYKGNRNANVLPGAAMISELVGNYWGAHADSSRFPGSYMDRYGVAARNTGALGWADSGEYSWGYGTWDASWYYTFCGIERSTTPPSTPTPSTTPSKTPPSTSPTKTTTTVGPNAGKSTGLNTGAIFGIVAGGAVIAAVIIVLILCLSCSCRCCCCFVASAGDADTSSASAVAESACADESRCAASQRGDMSRANSCRSCHSGYGDFSNRSFHGGAASKDGCSRRCSFHGGAGAVEAGVWQNDCEMTSVAGSHYSRAASGAYGSWAPPPRAASQMMMQPQPPMPMQPNMMMQPQPPMPMHGNWQM